ncbi:MAG: polyamine aminopropyltransferase [Candidatus Electrothrix sp. AR1]|nr:polyamine aminopropyltransferase [Candidatus Electrothrix sp. AR1]
MNSLKKETKGGAEPASTLRHDIFLILAMSFLACCGLIYEYLLAHYAGRILGALESSIYAMIGIMIVAMGIGAFLAKWIKCPYKGFVWLELGIALVGSCSILIMAVMMAVTYTLPQWLQSIYGLPSSITTSGGFVESVKTLSFFTPFIIGFILGLMIGMEIPLIARVREHVHGQHLTHNTGTIYGADYIGAGIGAAIWVIFCLRHPIILTAITTASVNLTVGVLFLWRYRSQFLKPLKLWFCHFVLVGIVITLGVYGTGWIEKLNYTLFQDKPIYSKQTSYQNITLTERYLGRGLPQVYSLYLNGRLQFSSSDERIYHSLLTYPPLLASARHDSILVIGGGDGLALRDILQWQPQKVTLVDLDADMIQLFSGKAIDANTKINTILLELNGNSLNSPKVEVIIGDAFIEVEHLVSSGRHFDTIIVDLPDPSHPDLNKLYSDFFYSRLYSLLSGDGAIAIQSTSPYHAQNAFISIGKTLASAHFITEQYHTNVPTFGEWGWTIGTKMGKSASQRIEEITELPIVDPLISKAQLNAAFVFLPNFYAKEKEVDVNRLGSHLLYQYHKKSWGKQDGVFFSQ